MTREEIKDLFDNYLSGTCSATEKEWVEQFLTHLSSHQASDLTDEMIQRDINEVYERIRPLYKKNQLLKRYYGIAATIALLLIGTAVYLYSKKETGQATPTLSQRLPPNGIDFEPGKNAAILTLSDGTNIALNDASEGKIMEQTGIKIFKNKDGLITYQISPSHQDSQSNTLSTPKGGQYQVILSDGTKVWLNAASKLTYPASFDGPLRQVHLEGEAYFEVARNERKPFSVVTKHQKLEVLGTQFNVNSYEDEPDTKTTLLEGSVSISSLYEKKAILLKPGEQARLKENGDIHVAPVNLENAIAWKSGLFHFEDSEIDEAMRQLARWYNVTIEFEGSVPDIKLWGEIHRNVHAKEALEILSYFDLKYKIVNQGNTNKIIIIR